MNSLKGHLLVATPQLVAPMFTRSVILMLEHSPGGAAGLILNRPTEATVASIADQVFDEPSDWEKAISVGGPVPGPMVIVHAFEALGDQEVIPGVFSTVDAAKVREIVRTKPEPALAVANYSGWAPGQLEGEIETGSWVTLPARSRHVFWEGEGELWRAVMKEYNARQFTSLFHLKGVPDDPTVN
ncbi:MAG: YqgE/AlgH family protein [Isosphaeraceae bacterium]